MLQDMFTTPLYQRHASHTLASRVLPADPSHARSPTVSGAVRDPASPENIEFALCFQLPDQAAPSMQQI